MPLIIHFLHSFLFDASCECMLDGHHGSQCLELSESFCLNQCSGRGSCNLGFCKVAGPCDAYVDVIPNFLSKSTVHMFWVFNTICLEYQIIQFLYKKMEASICFVQKSRAVKECA